jgi:hypothetical protein
MIPPVRVTDDVDGLEIKVTTRVDEEETRYLLTPRVTGVLIVCCAPESTVQMMTESELAAELIEHVLVETLLKLMDIAEAPTPFAAKNCPEIVMMLPTWIRFGVIESTKGTLM